MIYSVTYVHHNCFVLHLEKRTWVFDIPSEAHLPEAARRVLLDQVRDKNVLIFISHSHEDHFDPKIAQLMSGASRVRYVVSDDVPDMFPGAVPQDALVVEPDETYQWRGMTIETLMSNDLGVALCITSDVGTVYFGGDLANWNWETLGEKGMRMTQEFFHQALERVAKYEVQVAFSNVDDRLPSLAGGPEFVRRVRPRVFVPMHTFGNTGVLDRFGRELQDVDTRVFIYSEPGDRMHFETPEHGCA